MELWQQRAQQLHLKVARATVEVPTHQYSTMALFDTLSCVSCTHWSKSQDMQAVSEKPQPENKERAGTDWIRVPDGHTWLPCAQMKSISSRICTVLTDACASVGKSTPPAYHSSSAFHICSSEGWHGSEMQSCYA